MSPHKLVTKGTSISLLSALYCLFALKYWAYLMLSNTQKEEDILFNVGRL